MRLASFPVLLLACAHAAPSRTCPSVLFSGALVTPGGDPIANAEVAIFDGEGVDCRRWKDALIRDTQPPSVVWQRVTRPEDRGQVRIVRTDAAGHWTTHMRFCDDHGAAYAWAPGRAVAVIEHRAMIAGAVRTVLVPEVTLELVVPCDRAPCLAGAVHFESPAGLPYHSITPGDFGFPAGGEQRHVYHALPAGTYHVLAVRGQRAPGELLGTAAADTAAGKTTRVDVALAPTGTGAPLVGTLQLDMTELGPRPPGDRIEIQALCHPEGGRELVRLGVTHGPGSFRVDDIPPGPCQVSFTLRNGEFQRLLCAAGPIPADEHEVYVRSLKLCPPPQPALKD